MRIEHVNLNVNLSIFAHLNVNSVRNRLKFLAEFVRGKVDILTI